jgi:hypothetical protein
MSDPEECNMKIEPWLLVLVVSLTVGCASPETATPVGTPLIAPASTPTYSMPTASPIPGTQAASAPGVTPIVDASTTPLPRDPAPIPVGPLSTQGPWRIFIARMKCKLEACPQQLWIMNEDGSGLQVLVEEPVISLAIRPGATAAHAEIAVVTGVEHEEGPPKELYMLTLPERRLTRIVRLSPSEDAAPLVEDFGWAENNAGRLAWSPGGSLLAFTGATWGPTSDVYTYNPTNGEVKQISDGYLQAVFPQWSPDGRWLIHEAEDTQPEPGPPVTNGIWISSGDGEIIHPLFDPMPEGKSCGDYPVFGWPTPNTVFAGAFRCDGRMGEIRAIDLETGEMAFIRAAADLEDAAYNPAGNEWLFLHRDNDDTTPDRLVYQNATGAGEVALESEAVHEVAWSGTLEMFMVKVSYETMMGWTPDRRWIDLHAPDSSPALHAVIPTVAPGGKVWAWVYGNTQSSDPTLWISAPFEEPRQIEDSLVERVFWSPDSNHLLYPVAMNGFWIASAPDFIPRRITEAEIGSVSWSADGSHAFFTAAWGADGLWIADAPDFAPRLISDSLYHFGTLYTIPAE